MASWPALPEVRWTAIGSLQRRNRFPSRGSSNLGVINIPAFVDLFLSPWAALCSWMHFSDPFVLSALREWSFWRTVPYSPSFFCICPRVGFFFFYLKGKVWVSAVCGSRWNVSGRHCWMQPLIVCCSQNNFSLNSGLLKPQAQVHPEACCRDLDFSRWVLTQSFPPAAQVQCAKLRLWSDKSWRKGVTDGWLIMPLNSAIVITASLLLLF